ncbi:MAG: TIGR02678 family protein [Frisingicoccus sp.]|nr:TIGR02678 family protein [Frisingicoccus sp.]
MKELEILLDRRWILKSEDKELYYKVRDSIGEIRRFATEKMGCQIIENSLLVKMEKIPAIPQAFMGIEDFTSREEYVFLCMLLMFLEDKDGEEQFILSQLTEYIEANMPGTPVDWTIYTNRRRMVKVLRYAASQGLIKVTDGSDDLFMDEKSGEVLYENTGASRYFMRNFSRDIMDYTSPEDFRESDWFDVDEDRGIARRHRVYKRLLFSVGMYKNAGSEEDFEYLKYYGRRLAEDLEQNFDCQVHIHKGSAFFMMGDDCRMGAPFPGNNALSDIILLCCGKIREKVTGGLWKTGSDDRIIVEKIEFENMLKEVKAEKGSGFTKNYREMPEGEFVRELTDNLERWTFIGRDETKHQVVIYPSAGKMAGRYPEDYTGGNKNEQ